MNSEYQTPLHPDPQTMEELLQVKPETNWYNIIFKYCLLILYFFTILNKLLLLQLNSNILCNFKVEIHWCFYN